MFLSPLKPRLRRMILAIQFWTRLPTPPLHDVSSAEWQQGVRHGVAVGLLIGCLLLAGAWSGMHGNEWSGALLVLLLWLWITGGLHLDGVADLADARGAAHGDAARFIAVLKDPHIGSFGVIAVVSVMLCKLVLLQALLHQGTNLWALVLIPAWARWGCMLWAVYTPSLTSGTGDRFAAALPPRLVVVYTLVLFLLSLLVDPLACAFVLPLLGWWWHLVYRVGGMNGDCLGAGIEWSECAMLAIVAIGT